MKREGKRRVIPRGPMLVVLMIQFASIGLLSCCEQSYPSVLFVEGINNARECSAAKPTLLSSLSPSRAEANECTRNLREIR